MNFHLNFPIKPFEEKINYKQKLMFIGSCFAENIGELMKECKFQSMINPNGILYNPQSISTSVIRYIENKKISGEELFYSNELWNSWEHHSCFSHTDKETCLKTINQEIEAAHHFLKTAQWLFITLGSAHIYKHIQSGTDVGNCHKIPQKQFEKRMLFSALIVEDYSLLLKRLNAFNPNLKIIFTVSPVRYIRDGVVENNLSKAQLLTAVHELVNKIPNCFYFPAYELVIDDLRDYRFYKQDMVHPNEQAVDYVFDKLRAALLDDDSSLLYSEIKNIINAKKHRPINEQTDAHKKFKNSILHICTHLAKKHPHLDFTDEQLFFS